MASFYKNCTQCNSKINKINLETIFFVHTSFLQCKNCGKSYRLRDTFIHYFNFDLFWGLSLALVLMILLFKNLNFVYQILLSLLLFCFMKCIFVYFSDFEELKGIRAPINSIAVFFSFCFVSFILFVFAYIASMVFF
ncbi:hypothetical protein CAV_1742 [Campylobacter avium LMG 24591]|uniref:Uncharacterized protein n=1 Tax=Campylobacter avium LMG 24591 TaxID=522484 RepID=A0A222MWL3_9BACT|nr:hypothetical protein [Campylobacter avium]ASQ30299.1 hypothetical protein CAV_1742 [Campylobacter avium LMG 24591]OYD79397.1 hypothetical protein CAV8706_0634 [Campylobacter avium]